MRRALPLLLLLLACAATCTLNRESLPDFGEACADDDDCPRDFVCFEFDGDQGICVEEGSVAEGEGEGDGGEGEGPPPVCDPACTGNLLCVDGVCRVPCDADNPCGAATIACCGGVCRDETECPDCTLLDPGDCAGGQSCLLDVLTSSTGFCVDQSASPIANFEACSAGSFAGNVCEPDSQCLAFVGVDPVCLPLCVDDGDCPAGGTCNIDAGEAIGICFPGCDPLGGGSECTGIYNGCSPLGDDTCGGFCFATGPADVGESCANELCLPGLLCIGDRCATQCDPADADPACTDASTFCLQLSACPSQGACATRCDYGLNDCPVGQDCFPETGCPGFCFAPGVVAEGGACSFFECAAGLVCEGNVCRERCTLGTNCASGSACQASVFCDSAGFCPD